MLNVCVDPGHGGYDPGAIYHGSKEKDIVLSVALEMQGILSISRSIKLTYTRKADIFLPLGERVEIANRSGADLFLSIHCNADADADGPGDPIGEGKEVWVYKQGVPFAEEISKSLREEFKGERFRGIKKGSLWVTKHTSMPASLVELGFIDNPLTTIAFKSPVIRRRLAWSLVRALVSMDQKTGRN